MRALIAFLLIALTLPVYAEDAKPLPKDLQPIPEPPPAPAGMELDPAFEPQVTIIKRGTDTVEEYRIGGKLYMLKVTPPHGVSYYLVDPRGDGQFSRQDNLDSGVRVPQWVLMRF
ncbi:MAG: DUF2782 domain-containing protein [Sulfuricella sp.]|nr:DUF2782 domain-containing protein [Sulfuricella sp.]